MATSLPEILAENNIRLKSIPDGGRSVKAICPQCEGGRTREHSLSVTVDEDEQGAVWRCHRGKCGWAGSGRAGGISNAGMHKPKVYKKPEPQSADHPEWMYDWWADRKITAATVDALHIYAHKGAIVFPYIWDGDTCNRKYRAPGPEKKMWQEVDPLPTLFNVDSLGPDPEEIIFVEGEPDVAAMYDCGYKHTVTLKDGAPKEAKFEADGLRFEALKTHSEILNNAKRIVLAGDTDAPGLALREELARRLGRHRCRMVTWPAGCKDAGDVLLQQGREALVRAMEDSEPWPIEGIQSSYTGQLVELWNTPMIPTMGIGIQSADDVMTFPTEGRLCVVTGWPQGGKSVWTRYLMIASIASHDRRWAVFTPEMNPWQEYLASCAEVIVGKTFWNDGPNARMDDKDAAHAEKWLAGRMSMIVADALEEPPTLDWVMEKAKICVLRDGTTDLLIDPWNEIDNGKRDGMSETDFIGRSLQRLKAFCARYGCNVWVVAHPAKPPPLKGDEKRKPPGAFEINGSANWFNKCDVGITVDSPEDGVAEIHCWKSRFRRWSKKGASVKLEYNKFTGRYAVYNPYKPRSMEEDI